jgi:hypothetical protein
MTVHALVDTAAYYLWQLYTSWDRLHKKTGALAPLLFLTSDNR